MGLSAPLALPIIGARPSEVRTLIRLSVAEIMKIEGERERERDTKEGPEREQCDEGAVTLQSQKFPMRHSASPPSPGTLS